jgi:phosphorylated CTD-interacting factor 1
MSRSPHCTKCLPRRACSAASKADRHATRTDSAPQDSSALSCNFVLEPTFVTVHDAPLDQQTAPESRRHVPSDEPPDASAAALLAETIRIRSVESLRDHYARLVTQGLRIAPPKLSFNRWLVERALNARRQRVAGDDPLLPPQSLPLVSSSLMRELMDDIPVKVNHFPTSRRHAADILAAYAKACSRLALDGTFAHAPPSPEDRDELALVPERCRETLAWLNAAPLPGMRAIQQRLKHMQAVNGPVLRRKVEPTVRSICAEMARRADAAAHEVAQTAALRAERARQLIDGLAVVCDNGAIGCVAFCLPDRRVSVSLAHLDKLRRLYALHHPRHGASRETAATAGPHTSVASLQETRSFSNGGGVGVRLDDPESEAFNACVARLLLRYEACAGSEGAALQSALPPAAFAVLTDALGVEMECFASPLNCHYARYCSAFPDVDARFGSRGSFFDFWPASGSFEANPPFVEELVRDMAAHIDRLLRAARGPLSFCVFLPDWQDAEGNMALARSPFLRGTALAEPQRHSYMCGKQHSVPTHGERVYTAVHATRVFVLQNEAGLAKWTPTPERLAALREGMARPQAFSHSPL